MIPSNFTMPEKLQINLNRIEQIQKDYFYINLEQTNMKY
jgi:hypothetical protein